MGRPLSTLDLPASHTRWLHELRSVVTTASVAASVGRDLVGQDADSALELLREAEQALAQCRALLDGGAEHVRPDEAAPRSDEDATPSGAGAELRRARGG